MDGSEMVPSTTPPLQKSSGSNRGGSRVPKPWRHRTPWPQMLAARQYK